MPASVCNPSAADLGFDGRISVGSGSFEARRRILMNAEVQTYIRSSELIHDFDAMLDQNIPLEQIYKSDTYMQLLALQQVQKQYHQELESYFAAKIKQEAGPGATEAQRVAAVHKVVDSFQGEFQSIVDSKPANRYEKLALMDIQDDYEDLRNYNATCDYEAIHAGFIDRMKKRVEQTKEIIKTTPIVKNAHKSFAMSATEGGVDVDAVVKKSAKDIRKQIQNSSERNPQATTKIEPSAGPNGNMFGDKFPPKTWALTFDDGPGATTHLVLDNLKTHKMKATFFLISQNLQNTAFQSVAKQTQSDGHALGCHSMTHPQIPKLDQAGRTREIVGAKKVFTDFFSTQPGDTPPLFFRLPYGAGVSVPSVRQMIADANMIHVYWNVDTLDWQDHNPQSILARTLKQMTQLDRGIILFHDIHSQSVVASELLMHYLEDPANKIKLVTIPEITSEMNANAVDIPVVVKPVKPEPPVVVKPAPIKPSPVKKDVPPPVKNKVTGPVQPSDKPDKVLSDKPATDKPAPNKAAPDQTIPAKAKDDDQWPEN